MAFSKLKLAIALMLVLFISVATASATGNFTLGLYQGIQFSNNAIIASDSPLADLSMYPRYRGGVAYATLSATKIKEFDGKPNLSNITAKDVEKYKELVFAPAEDYYYLVKSKTGRYYLCKLDKFENQGKAQKYWELTFSYEELYLN